MRWGCWAAGALGVALDMHGSGVAVAGRGLGVHQPEAGADREAEVAWLGENGADPVEYACALFDDADMVIIGEIHEVADNCRFVASLLHAAYHEAGVRALATEFIRSSLNERAHAVVTAEEWDEGAAVDIFREAPWPTWGYREYVDIVEAAWRVNSSLPDDAEPLRVVGIDADWRQMEVLSTKDRAERFQMVLGREEHMHGVVDGLIDGPGKTLVHVGMAHSVFIGEHRLAARLRKAYGRRVQHLVLHHEMTNREGRSAVTERLDGALVGLGGPVAFGMAGSPFGGLRDPGAAYARMLGADATLSSFIEHYAMLAPIDRLEPVRWIPGFIQEDRLEEAIWVGERLRWIDEGAARTAEEANRAFAERLEARRR